MLDFSEKHGVKTIATIGGYRMEPKEKPKVYIAATNHNILNKAIEGGATLSTSGSPIVGTAGLILGLAKFKHIEATLPTRRNTRLPPRPPSSQMRH